MTAYILYIQSCYLFSFLFVLPAFLWSLFYYTANDALAIHLSRSRSLSISFASSWHRRYVKNLPQGYCLLPETKAKKRAQKQTNFSITRWGGSLVLLLFLLLASAHLADATFSSCCCCCFPSLWGFVEYRHRIKPKRGKIPKTYRVYYLMFLKFSTRINEVKDFHMYIWVLKNTLTIFLLY